MYFISYTHFFSFNVSKKTNTGQTLNRIFRPKIILIIKYFTLGKKYNTCNNFNQFHLHKCH